MKFCVRKGIGGTALNKRFVAMDSHKHCLPDLQITETALVPRSKINLYQTFGGVIYEKDCNLRV